MLVLLIIIKSIVLYQKCSLFTLLAAASNLVIDDYLVVVESYLVLTRDGNLCSCLTIRLL